MTPSWLDPLLLRAVDAYYRWRPRPRPAPNCLQQACIISHRGERTAPDRLENTFAAFDPLPDRVFGLECDVRFTRDGVPVVFHDADLLRIHACRERLADLDYTALRLRFPQIPSLSELVHRYGRRLHLMIEFKAEPRLDPEAQLRAVAEALSPLTPAQDFHLLSLDLATLDWLGGHFPRCRVPIARRNVRQMSDFALRHDCAALTGHYALLGAELSRRHKRAGQRIGVGFPASRHGSRFALHQGADWIFTDQALAMQAVLEREKSASSA